MEIESQVIKLLTKKLRLDENEIQPKQCPINIEIAIYKRGSESKKCVHEYQNSYLESLQ